MTKEQWLALGLAGLSMALWLGWQRLKQSQVDIPVGQGAARPWVRRTATFFYFVGLPYLALIFGVLPPRLLGLKGLEYFTLIDWYSDSLLLQFQQATTLTLLEWLLDSQAVILVGAATFLIFIVIHKSLSRQRVEINVPWESPLFTLYYAVHWAFYRAVFWRLTDDIYLGVVLGAALVMVEWMLLYRLEKQWLARRQQFLVQSIILILTTTVFYYGPNSWLLLPIHWVMVIITNRNWGSSPVATKFA